MKLFITSILSVFCLFTHCSKADCDIQEADGDCQSSTHEACDDAPPEGETCMAYFTRWFYNETTNQCEEIGYSGCSQLGFETEQECEQCECAN